MINEESQINTIPTITSKENMKERESEIFLTSKVPKINLQAEGFIQLQSNCPLPALLFEVTTEHFTGWDTEDLENFFKEVGEVQLLFSNKSSTIIVYTRYYDAYIAIEFFKNPKNFKEDNYDEKFHINWLNVEKDLQAFPDNIVAKIQDIKEKTPSYAKLFYGNNANNSKTETYSGNSIYNQTGKTNVYQNKTNNQGNYSYINGYQNLQNQQNPQIHQSSHTPVVNKYSNFNKDEIPFSSPLNLNGYASYHMTPGTTVSQSHWTSKFDNSYQGNSGYQNNPSTMNPSNTVNQTSNTNSNHSQMPTNSQYQPNNQFNKYQRENTQNNSHKNTDEESKEKTGKFTCRFELTIENDREFQVARKLIGAKGYNMKKIVESCGGFNTQNDVKLRLRGKGSGYKEGPYNQESEDPLHLCISSKNYEKYYQACGLVQDLINSVFEEYKKYCYKVGKTPVSKFVIKKEEGLSNKKGFTNM